MARMKTVFWLPAACAFLLALPSCDTMRTGPGPSAVTGPFDSNGNYREDWADSPSKWRKSSDAPSPHELKSDELPEIAKNDQPPDFSYPLPPKSSNSSNSSTKPKASSREVEVASRTTKSRSSSASTSKSSKSKSSTAGKSSSKSSRYIVKSGDSLSTIASRNGSSVSAIQRANGISGTMIRPGQALTIPKK